MKIKLFAVAILSVCMLSACTPADTQGTGLGDSGKATDFTLKDINGNDVSLSGVLKEKDGAVLVFGATWCPYCVQEIPDVNAYYAANKDKIAVLGIDIKESHAKVSSFAKKKGIKYTMLLDSDGKVANAYGVRGIPSIMAVGKDGSILYRGHDIVEMNRKTKF